MKEHIVLHFDPFLLVQMVDLNEQYLVILS